MRGLRVLKNSCMRLFRMSEGLFSEAIISGLPTTRILLNASAFMGTDPASFVIGVQSEAPEPSATSNA